MNNRLDHNQMKELKRQRAKRVVSRVYRILLDKYISAVLGIFLVLIYIVPLLPYIMNEPAFFHGDIGWQRWSVILAYTFVHMVIAAFILHHYDKAAREEIEFEDQTMDERYRKSLEENIRKLRIEIGELPPDLSPAAIKAEYAEALEDFSEDEAEMRAAMLARTLAEEE